MGTIRSWSIICHKIIMEVVISAAFFFLFGVLLLCNWLLISCPAVSVAFFVHLQTFAFRQLVAAESSVPLPTHGRGQIAPEENIDHWVGGFVALPKQTRRARKVELQRKTICSTLRTCSYASYPSALDNGCKAATAKHQQTSLTKRLVAKQFEHD